MTQPYSVLEGQVLREQSDAHRRVLAEAFAPVEVNVVRFVQEMLSGQLGHARYEWKGEALADIRIALEEHYKRSLTHREVSELVNVVARAWTDREEAKAS